VKGTPLTENDDYDIIFAALKNPTRRQVLVLLEQKGEASFTDIQNALNLSDTGLLSYHLKELGVLVCQSSRGKYSLSEIGQTSMALFNKVEKDKKQTRKMVQKEVDSYITRHFKSSFILAGLIIVNWMIPNAADILTSVQAIHEDTTVWTIASITSIALLAMTFVLFLFVIYDRHYYSKNLKTNIIHATIFTTCISAVVLLATNSTINFIQVTLEMGNAAQDRTQMFTTLQWSMAIIRTAAYVVAAPALAYAVNKLSKRSKTAF
jgi:DNA-binding transcriptional ArsR family regulator